MINNELTTNKTFYDNTYYTNIVLQCTNKLSRCSTPEELIKIFSFLHDQIKIPCYLKINLDNIKINSRFGNFKITSKLFNLLESSNFSNVNVFYDDSYLICKYSNCYSIFKCSDTEQVDSLQDILAILCESVSNWSNIYELSKYENEIQKSNISRVLKKISDVTISISKNQIEIPNELISSIATNLNHLGMDSDHEDYVLDVIQNAIKSYNNCFNLQLESNIEANSLLRSLLENTDRKQLLFEDSNESDVTLF